MAGKKINIFNYSNFREYLRDYYNYYRNNTRYFSYRYFSKLAGFSSQNVLHQVITGKRNIAKSSIDKFSQALLHTNQESEYFRLLVLFGQAKKEEEKVELYGKLVKLQRRTSSQEIEEWQNDFYREWYYPVLRELVTVKNFSEDYEKIAQSIFPSITPSQARKGIQRLIELGFLARDKNGRLKQTAAIMSTAPEVQFLLARKHLHDMIEKANHALDDVAPKQREISTMTIGTNAKIFDEVKSRIQQFKEEILQYINDAPGEAEDIYQLNFQFFPFLRKLNNGDAADGDK